MMTVDQLGQAVALAGMLASVQSLAARCSGSVQFSFPDGQGLSAAISDGAFVSALQGFFQTQQVALAQRLRALGVNAS